MAGRIEVAQGYVTIIPSLRGAQKRIESELTPAATAAGKKAGEAIERGVTDGANKGAKSAGDKVREAVPRAAESAGKEAGNKVAEGLTQPISKASDKVAKDVQAKMGDMAKGIGNKFRDFGSSLGSSMSMTKAMFGDAFGEIGSKLSGSKVGQAFSGIASSAKGAMSQVTGTIKGAAGFMGGAFLGAAGKVGAAFKTAGAVASVAFTGIKTAVGGVVDHVKGAFSSLGKAIANGPLGKMGDMIKSAMPAVAKGAAAGVAAVASAAAAIGAQSMSVYKDYEQLVGGVDTLFGESSNQLQIYAYDAYSTAQISANDFMRLSTSFAGSLLQSLDGDTAKAADQANKAIIDMSDNASKMGSNIEDIQNAYQGFAKQNYTMLDNLKLGYGGTKTEMERLLADAEKISGVHYDIESFSDIVDAIHVVQDEMGIAGSTFDEAGTTIEGSVNKMKASWENWVGGLARDDANMGLLTQRLSESVEDVAANVIPRAAQIVSTVVQQLPSLVATIGPPLGEALVTILDSATGGLATKALEMVQPITDALSQAFGDGATWFGDNAGVFGEIGDKLGDIGGKISEGIGAAITTVAPIVGSFASGALTFLNSGLDLLSGALDFASGLLTHLSDAFGPVLDALSPVAQAIGDAANGAFQWFCDKMSAVGDALSNVDWDGWATTVSNAMQTVVDFVGARIDDIRGFFEGMAAFINDPIGTLQSGLGELFGATSATSSDVQGNFNSMQAGVASSTSGMVGSIGRVNSAKLNNKTATIKGTGNAIDGTAVSKIGETRGAIRDLDGKTVTVSVTGNAVSGSAKSNLDAVYSSINSLYSKTVNVHTNYTSSGFGQKATGAIVRRFASGAIFTKPTMTDVGLIGEAGAEAVYSNGRDTGIFPLTNRRYTGPFAREIADQLRGTMPQGNNNTFYIDGAGDPEAVADAVARRLALLSA